MTPIGSNTSKSKEISITCILHFCSNYKFTTSMKRKVIRVASIAAVLALSACAMPTPSYSPSVQHLSQLEKISPVKLGQFSVADPAVEKVSLRASSLVPSVGKSFSDYLKYSAQQELELAHKFVPDSPVELSAVLLENKVDANGFSVGKAKLRARFMIRKNAQETYSKEITAEDEWESSFAGAVAIPAAANQYPLTVQKLLGNLFNDSDFVKATLDNKASQ